MADEVTFESGEDAVGVVRLNRPDKLNALSHEVFTGLHEAAEAAGKAAAEGACRAVLVIGQGRAFSAGLDVSLFAQQVEGGAFDEGHLVWLQRSFTRFEELTVPTVAAVRGVAVGGGCQLAIACHLRLVAPDARFGLLETRWGLIPDLGASYRLPRLIGLSRASDLAISARMIDAQTALAWGLADTLLDGEDFEAEARAFVARLAAGPTLALGSVPALMRAGFNRDREAALAAERAAQRPCVESADFHEAAISAIQGRKPHFTGR